jgi:hypothetical protein
MLGLLRVPARPSRGKWRLCIMTGSLCVLSGSVAPISGCAAVFSGAYWQLHGSSAPLSGGTAKMTRSVCARNTTVTVRAGTAIVRARSESMCCQPASVTNLSARHRPCCKGCRAELPHSGRRAVHPDAPEGVSRPLCRVREEAPRLTSCASSSSTITPSGRIKGWRIGLRLGQVHQGATAPVRFAARAGSVGGSSTITDKLHAISQIML